MCLSGCQEICMCVYVSVCIWLYAVGGLVLLDRVASISGHGAQLAQHIGGESQSY